MSVFVCVFFFYLFGVWGLFFLQPEEFRFKFGGDNFETS